MLILLCPPQAELEAKQIWLGTSNSPLSGTSRGEAQELAYHDHIQNDRAYVCPAEHTQEYAGIVLANEFTTVAAFTDRSMGTLTGRSYRETLKEFPRRNWLGWQRSYWIAPPEGESLFDISDQVLTAFRTQVLPVTAAEKVAVVAPANVIRLIIGFLTKVDEQQVTNIEVQTNVPYVINGDLNI